MLAPHSLCCLMHTQQAEARLQQRCLLHAHHHDVAANNTWMAHAPHQKIKARGNLVAFPIWIGSVLVQRALQDRSQTKSSTVGGLCGRGGVLPTLPEVLDGFAPWWLHVQGCRGRNMLHCADEGLMGL